MRLLACCVLALSAPAAASAQLSWESPQMLGPGSPAGLSLIFVDFGLDPNPGLGGMLIWRAQPAPHGIGLRASAAQGIGNRLNYAAGVDVASSLLRSSAQFPLDLIWTSGGGVSVGEYVHLAVPVGVSGGKAMSSGNLWFNPYTSARAILEARVGDAAPEGTFSLGLAIDVGADLAFGRSRNYMMRMAVSLGDRHAAAVGMHLGGGSSTRTAASPVRALPAVAKPKSQPAVSAPDALPAIASASSLPASSSAAASAPAILATAHGEATYYADKFDGRRTASGIVFRNAEMYAAHREYPFGTVVRVTNLSNDRSVVLHVVDRGPNGTSERARRTIIDVSQRAAQLLDFVAKGRVNVSVEVLEWGNGRSRPLPE